MNFAQAHNDDYDFPEIPGDGTKWGPTDFYDEVREHLTKAFESGLDFETGWLGCKKEILSSRIIRSGDTISVDVSILDDLDTSGSGSDSFDIPEGCTADQFFELLETAGSNAHEEASENQKDNAGYIGYSVGRIGEDGKAPWQFTYLVNVFGTDYPTGDNYYRWGWQEVPDDSEDDDLDAHPEEIPAKVASKLAEGIQAGRKTVRCQGWLARKWND